MDTKEQVIKILSQHGIKMSIGSCGCCGSPWVSFEYNGKMIVNDEESFSFNMFIKGNSDES